MGIQVAMYVSSVNFASHRETNHPYFNQVIPSQPPAHGQINNIWPSRRDQLKELLTSLLFFFFFFSSFFFSLLCFLEGRVSRRESSLRDSPESRKWGTLNKVSQKYPRTVYGLYNSNDSWKISQEPSQIYILSLRKWSLCPCFIKS